MDKVYVVWAITEDCSEIHEICATKEKAEQEKERLLTDIHLIKLNYKEQFDRNYDQDKEKIMSSEYVSTDLVYEFYNFSSGYSYELKATDVYIQEHTVI